MRMQRNNMFVLDGKKYAMDLEKIKSFCLTSDKERGGQVEVMEVQEPGDNGLLGVVSKTVHEVKSTGNPQNDTIAYDLIKLLIVTLLDTDVKYTDTTMDDMTIGMRLAFNTMLQSGLIYEINEETL